MSDVMMTRRHNIMTLGLFVIHTDQLVIHRSFFQNALVEYIGVCTDTNEIGGILYGH